VFRGGALAGTDDPELERWIAQMPRDGLAADEDRAACPRAPLVLCHLV